MTLLQMQYFIQICEDGSTLKASQSLNVSQSAISSAIKALESELSVALFERTARGMIPNAAGLYFLEHCRKILQDVSSLSAAMEQFSAIKRPIRLGIPVLLNYIYWIELYFELKTAFPEIEFEVVNRTVPVLLEMLEKNSLDAVIAMRNQQEERPYCMTLMESPYTYVSMSVRHPLAEKTSVTYQDLLPYPVLGYAGDSLKTKIIQQEYAKYNAELKYAQRFDQISTLIQFLRRNTGIAYLTKKLTDSYPDLVSIPIETKKSPLPAYLIWSKSSLLNRMPKRFFQVVRNYFESQEEG